MQIYISEVTGSAYWREGNDIHFCPINTNNTFDTIQGGIVETWEEVSVDERNRIESLTL